MQLSVLLQIFPHSCESKERMSAECAEQQKRAVLLLKCVSYTHYSLYSTEAPAFLLPFLALCSQFNRLCAHAKEIFNSTVIAEKRNIRPEQILPNINLWWYNPSADDQDIRSVQLP